MSTRRQASNTNAWNRHAWNALPSALWTALFLGPIYLYCAHFVPLRLLYVFAAIGTLSFATPRSVLQRLQLSATPARYRRLRVPLLMRFTQEAPWIRRRTGGVDPLAFRHPAALARLTSDTWMRERFHTGLFVFCSLCAALALIRLQLTWLFTLALSNILYNLYPIWIQQFIRMRSVRLLRHTSTPPINPPS